MKAYEQIVEPFTLNQLQYFVVLAGRAEQAGYTLDEFIAAVRADLDNRQRLIVGRRAEKLEPRKRRRCPSCGRGKMISVVTGDKTVQVEECKICWYSEVVG